MLGTELEQVVPHTFITMPGCILVLYITKKNVFGKANSK